MRDSAGITCCDSSCGVQSKRARTNWPSRGPKEEPPVAVKRIQADEVLSRFLGTLDLGQDQYLIEAEGKPIAGVVPP